MVVWYRGEGEMGVTKPMREVCDKRRRRENDIG